MLIGVPKETKRDEYRVATRHWQDAIPRPTDAAFEREVRRPHKV